MYIYTICQYITDNLRIWTCVYLFAYIFTGSFSLQYVYTYMSRYHLGQCIYMYFQLYNSILISLLIYMNNFYVFTHYCTQYEKPIYTCN